MVTIYKYQLSCPGHTTLRIPADAKVQMQGTFVWHVFEVTG